MKTINARRIAKTLLTGVFSLTLLAPATTLMAQGPPPSRDQLEEHARKRIEEMRTRLELTDEQQQEIQPVLEEQREAMREIRESHRGEERSQESMEAVREELRTLHEETRGKLEPILTETQLAEYDSIHEEWRKERKERRGARGGKEAKGGRQSI